MLYLKNVGSRAVGAAFALAVCCAGGTAAANELGGDDDGSSPTVDDGTRAAEAGSASSKRETYRYGEQIAIVDAVSVASYALGVGLRTQAPAVIGTIGYLFGGPTVHLAHGRAIGVVDFVMRGTMPLVTAFAGYLILGGHCEESPQCTGMDDRKAAGVGLFAGMGGAMLIDALLLARGTRSVAEPERTPIASPVRLTGFGPTLDPRTRTLELHAGGSF